MMVVVSRLVEQHVVKMVGTATATIKHTHKKPQARCVHSTYSALSFTALNFWRKSGVDLRSLLPSEYSPASISLWPASTVNRPA
jgi:hypothetical protein